MPRSYDHAFLAIALVCLAANACEPALWMMAVKPLPTLWLVLVAHRFTRGALGLSLVLGVACGALGDALLAPERKGLFPAGVLAFLVGHFFYVAAFRRRSRLDWRRWPRAVPLALLGLVLCGFVQPAMAARGEAAEFVGVALYMVVLVAMATVALVRESASPHVAAGAVIFVISDAHIALNNLIFATPTKALMFSGMATYYLAQVLIVKGMALEVEGARSPP